MTLRDIHLRFAWQAWRLWHWAGSGGALELGLVAGGGTLRGRRVTARHPPSFHVAGVALGDIHLCVAGVALGDIHLRFTWQVWHLETSNLLSFRVAGVALMALGWLWWRAWAGIGHR